MEYALVARARISLLPEGHPTRAIFDAAKSGTLPSWVPFTQELLALPRLGEPIAEITSCTGFSDDYIQHARADKAVRKALLRRYRWEVVRPRLLAMDLAEYYDACAKPVPTLGIPFAVLEPNPGKLSVDLLRMNGAHGAWRWYRAWAMIRVSGRWPAPVWGCRDFPMVLDGCPFCGCTNVNVLHPLLECGGFEAEYAVLKSRWGLPSRLRTDDVVFALFGHTSDISRVLDVVRFVGTTVMLYIGSFGDQAVVATDTEDGQARFVALLQQAARDADAVANELDERWDEVAHL
jgi:hypothetical protein